MDQHTGMYFLSVIYVFIYMGLLTIFCVVFVMFCQSNYKISSIMNKTEYF